MGQVIQFEEHAVARLRERLGAAEEANQDLIAFARGHSGAVASIHAAVLAAMETDCVETLLHVITQEWPLILGIDAVAVGLLDDQHALRADGSGVQPVDATFLRRQIGELAAVEMRTVERGHPLFGPACELIRAEALVLVAGNSAPACGVIALGQRAALPLDARHGSELLLFLGRSVATIIARWPVRP